MKTGRLLIPEEGLYGREVRVLYHDSCRVHVEIPGEGTFHILREEIEIDGDDPS